MSYHLDKIFEEVAFIAYHFHWPLKDILNLEHDDRQRFIDEISAINERLNSDQGADGTKGIPLQFWAE